MPCPEKFRESLEQFGIEKALCGRINEGFEELPSRAPKKQKAAYFKRAMDLLDEQVDFETRRELLDWNACCRGGARDKASRAFSKEYAPLSLAEKLGRVAGEAHMGRPSLNADGTLSILAVEYWKEGEYRCGCSNFNNLRREYPVSKTYCMCCAGHFRYHYEKMLGVKLRLAEVVSSPLDSGGKNPCAFRFAILKEEEQ